jgi:hypothetical protein
MRASDVSDSDIQELAKNNPKLASKKGGKMSGSSQYFVKGRDYESIEKERAPKDKSFTLMKFYSEMSDKGKMSMQKMAVLDFITGNTDRHAGNIMIDGDNVHAIDNGRCFPGKDRSQFNSRPLAALRASKEKIHPKIIEAVKKVDKTKVVAMMKAHGMEEESKHVLERINDVLKSSGEFQLL